MQYKELFPFVIVGHVDHGKSTLIGRLLYDTNSLPEGKIEEIKKTCEMLGRELEFAYILDSLQEEREQNITIDTTQIFFNTEKRDYVIIDAPGHKEFLKNMITGASQAQAAILIVDTQRGIKEQTKRHAYLLNFLGIKQIVVVLNKMDLIKYKKERFEEIKKDLLEFLSSLNISPKFIIPISAKKGDNVASKSQNLQWFEGPTLLETLDKFEVKKEEKQEDLRFPIQDVYKFDEKRILVGRIESGILKKEEKIVFLPSRKETKIRTIEKFNENPSQAEKGKCIGITLEDKLFIERGEILSSLTNQPKIKKEIRASVFWMSPQKFKDDEKLSLRCATQEIGCKIKQIQKKMNSSTLELINSDLNEIKETEVAETIIKLDKKIVFDDFNFCPELGRFVLVRDFDVVAGGIIKE